MKRLLCSIIFVLLSFFSIFAEDIKLPRLAVVEFSINDPSNSKLVNDAVAVRNQVQSNIIKTGRYDVIARAEIDKLLENQQIQVSSISSKENLKRLKLQNISYLITGTVDAMDNDYIVSISLLDVESGKFAHSDEEFMGNSSSALYKGIQTLVSRFVGSLKDTGEEIISEKKRVRKDSTIATGIHVETGLGGILYLYNKKNYSYDEIAVLWENDSYDIPIDRPDTYKIKMKYADGGELIRDVEFNTRGVINVDFTIPPEDFKIKSITGTTVTLSWVPVDYGYGYEISYYPSNLIDKKNTIRNINREKNEYVIDSLEPNTNYTFILNAMENGYSKSVKSLDTTITKKTSDLKIRNLEIQNIGTDSVYLSYSKTFQNVRMKCKVSNSDSYENSRWSSFDEKDNTIIIKNLDSEKTYYIWIILEEKNKEGIPSDCIQVTTVKSKVGTKGETGGYIFYDKGFSSDGWRYLEAAPKEAEFKATWGPYNERIYSGDENDPVGMGKLSTQTIINHMEYCNDSHPAASRCINCSFGDKTDWFLPNVKEAELMYRNLCQKELGDFEKSSYWTSCERDINSAYGYSFRGGYSFHVWYTDMWGANIGAKGGCECFVRPVRAY